MDALRQKGQYTGGSLQQELNKIEGTVAGRDNTLEVLQMRRIQQTVQVTQISSAQHVESFEEKYSKRTIKLNDVYHSPRSRS